MPGDFPRLATALEAAHRKWAGGIYLLWYPIKDRASPDALARRLRRTGIAKILRAELTSRTLAEPAVSRACGLIVVNPPWTLDDELAMLLPELARSALAGTGRRQPLDWLAGERLSFATFPQAGISVFF